MSTHAELIQRLERATAAVARDLDEEPGPALSEREQTLCDIRAREGSPFSEEEAASLREVQRQGAALIERVRERRRRLLDQMQEAAAARCLAAALAPPAGRAIVDLQL